MSGRLEIDLGALAHNYCVLNRGKPETLAAVVKADAYGLGAVQVAKALWQQGCREYFVAQASEGVALRADLPNAAIYVLEGVTERSVATLQAHDLQPVLNSIEQCAVWGQTAKPAALQLDTGMARLGLNAEAVPPVIDRYGLDVGLLLTHFARADEVGHDFNAKQLERAMAVFRPLQQQTPELRLSLSNSAACASGVAPPADVVHLGRAGIGLYGGNPMASGQAQDVGLMPVARVYGQILQLREIARGSPVGYGSTYVAAGAERLMIIGVGYADGVPRLLSGQGHVFADGKSCAIRGRVSMDMLHADATAVDVSVGDWVEVIGSHISLDNVAQQAQTIAYEILTGLGKRLHRVYLNHPDKHSGTSR